MKRTPGIGATVRYHFDGADYVATIIDRSETMVTVRDSKGLRRVLHITALIEVIETADV